MSPIQRSEDGFAVGPTWESIVERKIQEAIEAGEFDNLPGMGRPQDLDADENPFAGDWRLGFRVLRNARVAPPWIELSKDIQLRLDARDQLLDRATRFARSGRQEIRSCMREDFARHVAELNQAIEEFNLVVPFVWLQKVPLVLGAELRAFDERWPD